MFSLPRVQALVQHSLLACLLSGHKVSHSKTPSRCGCRLLQRILQAFGWEHVVFTQRDLLSNMQHTHLLILSPAALVAHHQEAGLAAHIT